MSILWNGVFLGTFLRLNTFIENNTVMYVFKEMVKIIPRPK